MSDPSADDFPLPGAEWKQTLRRRLLRWYDRKKRDLPWRGIDDPYRIWVSEIMLQQTQVAAAIPYFERFTDAFPTVEALADAKEEEVLRAWEGLGYYRRARSLHQAARVIVSDHDGEFPDDPEQALRLPGVGRYTAGAILSIAFGLRMPILEANTLRLYSRLLGYHGDPRTGEGNRLLWAAAEDWLPRKRVGEFNQALMELGGQVCAPRNPDCDDCPLRAQCPTREHGWQDDIPVAAPKPKIEQVREAALAVFRDDAVFLHRNQNGDRWAGLWDFPRVSLDEDSQASPTNFQQHLAAGVRDGAGLTVEIGERLTQLKHSVTRFRITLDCFAATWISGPGLAANAKSQRPNNNAAAREFRWVQPAEFADLPLSVPARRLSDFLAKSKRQRGR
ncbi:MAG: A/G-specific adenine glycosylase [Planctomycetales bacterium]